MILLWQMSALIECNFQKALTMKIAAMGYLLRLKQYMNMQPLEKTLGYG